MIRSTASRARQQLAKPDRGPGSSSSSSSSRYPGKAFEKRIDKYNEVYYVLSKKKGRAGHADPEKQYKFFEMPDLLLDLDADGAPNVRSFNAEVDEPAMAARWSDSPRRAQVRAQLRQLQDQVVELRQKAHDVSSEPTNVWRITAHDVMSAALYGGSATPRKPAKRFFLQEPSEEVDGSGGTAPSPPQLRQMADKVRAKNGIPPHAVHQDQLLLHWMLLRRHCSENSPGQKAPSASQFAQAIESQTSLMGIRRLVSQSLAAGMSTASFFHSNTLSDQSLPRCIRTACERILSGSSSSRSLRLEVLTFLGNLSERLYSLGTCLGPDLCGLALKLAAEAGSVVAASAWLQRCHDHGVEQISMCDIQSTLRFLRSLQSDEHLMSKSQITEQRQRLLRLLTGIDDSGQSVPASLRSFVVLWEQQKKKKPGSEAQELFAGYMELLGHLGAARTIWAEWRELPGSLRRDNVASLVFGTALRQAIDVTPPCDGELLQSAGWHDCVMADYHAIGKQGMRASQAPVSKRIFETAAIRGAMDMPFEQCLEAINKS